MRIQLKKVFLISQIFIFLACSSGPKITISKINANNFPSYESAEFFLNKDCRVLGTNNDIDYVCDFNFNIKGFKLREQTETFYDYQLANSEEGQHIHFIVNGNEYDAHYFDYFTLPYTEEGTGPGRIWSQGNQVILAFLSRSNHISVKNPKAFTLTQITPKNPKILDENDQMFVPIEETQAVDLTKEFLFYSRPKGTYKGKDAEKVLLDFYLVNTEISPNGNKVRATINDTVFLIDEWAPYYIEGLNDGENQIELELIDSNGNLIDSEFNGAFRYFNIEK